MQVVTEDSSTYSIRFLTVLWSRQSRFLFGFLFIPVFFPSKFITNLLINSETSPSPSLQKRKNARLLILRTLKFKGIRLFICPIFSISPICKRPEIQVVLFYIYFFITTHSLTTIFLSVFLNLIFLL